jgi:shikimate kinase
LAPLILLTGFMGSGKSTTGREVARRLGWAFLDLDDAVVDLAGKDVPGIFRDSGEQGFRDLEVEALARLMGEDSRPKGLVVALGGGTLMNPAAEALVKGRATIVYLDVDSEVAWSRVQGSDRPLARDAARFAELLATRRPVYERVADVTIDAGRHDVEAVAEQVVRFVWRSREEQA